MSEEKKTGHFFALGHAVLGRLHGHYLGPIVILLVIGGFTSWNAWMNRDTKDAKITAELATFRADLDHCTHRTQEMAEEAARREKDYAQRQRDVDGLRYDLALTKKTVDALGAKFLKSEQPK